MSEIKVLDKGYVRLVSSHGDDLAIVRAARVSYDAEWRSGEDAGKDAKLISYMLKNGHTSPFEHVTFTFEVKAPIFIFRQWHRHRTWSYNELSARYTEMPDEYYVPDPAVIGTQSASNKQARDIAADADGVEIPGYLLDQIIAYRQTCNGAFRQYGALIAAGWPRELARAVLPVATYSKMFATVDLHNLLHFLKLRLHPHAQWEIRQYAQAMLDLIDPIVPAAITAWRGAIPPIE